MEKRVIDPEPYVEEIPAETVPGTPSGWKLESLTRDEPSPNGADTVAEEQENVARIEENRAKVVEAEAEVPKAISQAFREGTLGIMDYYKLRNIQADTEMRTSIAKVSVPPRRGGSPA